MRLGNSGLGVIAVVSLLVSAAPERDDSGGNNRGSSIDHSRSGRSERTSGTRYSWPSQVATETSGSGTSSGSSSSSSSFVKTEFESRGSTSPGASRHLPPRPTLVPPLRSIDRKPEIPTALARFTTDFPTSERAHVQPQNFKNAAIQPDVRLANGSLETTLEDNGTTQVDSSVPVSGSASGDFQEKLVVTLDFPLSVSIVGDPASPSLISRRRRGERGSTWHSQTTETRDNYDDKTSTSDVNEATKENSTLSSAAKSAGTMKHRLTKTTTTTMTATTTRRRRLPDENFRNATERYELKTIRGTRESSKYNGTSELSKGHPHFSNGQDEPDVVLRSSQRTTSGEANDDLHSESRYSTNYPVHFSSTIHFELQGSAINERMQRDQGQPLAEQLTDKLTTGMPKNHSPDKFVLVDKTLRKVEIALDEDSLVRDDAVVEQQGLTVKSMVEVPARKPERLGYSSVTGEIVPVRQIVSESPLDLPTIERPLLRFAGNVTNTSSIDVTPLLDNHKAMRVRSFQMLNTVQQQRQHLSASLQSPSLPPRLSHEIAAKDSATDGAITGAEIESPAIPVNQLIIPKSGYPVVKNLSKSSINLVEGKARKKYYEIKPSLITETDRGMNLEVTTTPKRTFDKFLLPSVPSAFGKFGPYFLDEEDRRNVTERIGNTVQLDCRIGLLGHRKVTWLQHYKDSFRLLTVERESYSVDRRISLNFQYPDNWRLQIAYASIRDSGLYKCQVEIDQDRSLVKRYNVIITAPLLTITDDSGRPVSGERHLKAGSALKLRCEARDVMQRLNESVLWMRGDETLTEDVSENRTTEIVNEKEITVVVSTLLVERATPRHAGNYSCVVPEKARTTIAVHVLNGELPAAVQHGSGVSTAVLNLWLIHLTASYGFFR